MYTTYTTLYTCTLKRLALGTFDFVFKLSTCCSIGDFLGLLKTAVLERMQGLRIQKIATHFFIFVVIWPVCGSNCDAIKG